VRRILLLSAALLLPLELQGQADPDSIKHRNDCRLAAQTVTTGRPANKLEWALHTIRRCPIAADDLARALSEARGSADTVLLKRLTAPTDWLIDGRIVETAVAILQDRGTSPQARVFAVRPLIWSLTPGGELEYGHLVDLDGDGRRSCGGRGPSFHGRVTAGEPLPAEWVERLRGVALTIHGDANEPTAVRQAVGCLLLTRPIFPLR
jgi:hypothetical protein